MKHKIARGVLTSVLCFVMSVSAFASAPVSCGAANEKFDSYEYSINEYDMIIADRAAMKEKVADAGLNYEKDLISREAEEELLRRSKMTTATLAEVYGYTEEQIEILKSYSGEPLEEVPAMRTVMASAQCSVTDVSNVTNSTAEMAVEFSWEWNQMPTVCHNDVVGVGWIATDATSRTFVTEFDEENSSCRIDYYTVSGTPRPSANPGFVEGSGARQATARFSMYSTNYLGERVYAKKGTMTVTHVVPPNTTGAIRNAYYAMSYGHATLNATPSMGFSYTGVDISVTLQRATEFFRYGATQRLGSNTVSWYQTI